MANPKGNEASLKKFKPKWRSGETRTIRVPIILANQILNYAHKLDESPSQADEDDIIPATALTVQHASVKLSQVLEVLEGVNSSKTFTKALRAKMQQQAIEVVKSLIQVLDNLLDPPNPVGIDSDSED